MQPTRTTNKRKTNRTKHDRRVNVQTSASLRCPCPRPAPCCCRQLAHVAIVLRRTPPCSPAPPPVLPQAAASRVASLRLACPPLRPCPEARLRAPHRCSPSAWNLTEIEWEWIPVRPSAPPRHPAPASISVGRRQARGFPPGQSPSPLMGAVPRPTLGSAFHHEMPSTMRLHRRARSQPPVGISFRPHQAAFAPGRESWRDR